MHMAGGSTMTSTAMVVADFDQYNNHIKGLVTIKIGIRRPSGIQSNRTCKCKTA